MGFLARTSALVAAGSWCAVAATAARGTDVVEYNFDTGPAGWTSPVGQWLYTAEGGNEKAWKLPLSGTNPAANYLYTPCFTITSPTVRFDLQQHRFSFGMSGTGTSLASIPPAGQVQYRLDDEPDWHGIPLDDWYPFVGPGGGSDTPPTLDPAALSVGTATLPADPLRSIWDVNQIQVKGVVQERRGPCAPEPGGLALAGSAAAAVSIAAWRGRSRWTRRRSRRPCSAPRKSPGPAANG